MGRWQNAWRALTGTAPKSKKAGTRGKRDLPVALSQTQGWFTTADDARAAVSKYLDEYRKTSRGLISENPWAARIIEARANAAVGTGIRPTVMVYKPGVKDKDGSPIRDDAAEAKVYDLFDKWSRQCVSGSALNFYGWQRAMWRAMDADGDGLTRLRTRYPADMPGVPPLKLQPVESDMLPTYLTEAIGNSLNRIYSGVEFDALGERAAYHLYKEHPGTPFPFTMAQSGTDTVRVPAAEILHAFNPLRPNQVRGLPALTPVLSALFNLGGYTDAIRVNARGAACTVATVEGRATDDDEGIATEHEGDDPSAPVVTDARGAPVEGLEPGLILRAAGGEKITIHTPNAPAGIETVISAALHEIAAGAGLSYHVLSGDMSDSSFAQAKLGLLEQAKNITVLREQVFIPMVLDPLWRAWVNAGVLAGLLPNREYAVRWSAPRQQMADRLDEAKAATFEIRSGLRSQKEVIESDYGRDPDDVLAEIAEEREQFADSGVVLDTDPNVTNNWGGPRYTQPATNVDGHGNEPRP